MSRRPTHRLGRLPSHHQQRCQPNKNIYYSDYEAFLRIVCKACEAYRVVLHDYALMSNHFHLMVETELENLSLFMKHINSNYAIYFITTTGKYDIV